jgi:hypothetical protein
VLTGILGEARAFRKQFFDACATPTSARALIVYATLKRSLELTD